MPTALAPLGFVIGGGGGVRCGLMGVRGGHHRGVGVGLKDAHEALRVAFGSAVIPITPRNIVLLG